MCQIGISEIENRKKWRKEMIAEKFLELIKNMNSHIQDTKYISSRISKRKPMQFPHKET